MTARSLMHAIAWFVGGLAVIVVVVSLVVRRDSKRAEEAEKAELIARMQPKEDHRD